MVLVDGGFHQTSPDGPEGVGRLAPFSPRTMFSATKNIGENGHIRPKINGCHFEPVFDDLCVFGVLTAHPGDHLLKRVRCFSHCAFPSKGTCFPLHPSMAMMEIRAELEKGVTTSG